MNNSPNNLNSALLDDYESNIDSFEPFQKKK